MMFNLKKNNNKKNNSFLNIIPNRSSLTFSNSSSFNNHKNISHEIPSKIITPIDFIKYKKKFIIPDSFDINGANNFLAEKKEAMMTINLEDDILEENMGIKFKKSNTNLFNLDSGNNSFIEENKRIEDKKVDGKKNNSAKRTSNHKLINSNSKKKKKPKYISYFQSNLNSNINSNINSNFKNNIKSYNKSNNTSENNNDGGGNNKLFIFNHHDSDKNDYLYKFIIENANETDDNFHKKFEKVVKEVESQKQNQLKSNNNKKIYIHKSSTSNMKEKENGRSNNESKSKRCGSIFMFSENSRKLMINDSKIGESSIIGENNIMVYHEKDKNNNNIKNSGNNEKNDTNIFYEKRGFIDKSKLNSLKSILNVLV